ncbi:hypothetical protein [Microbacterium rhizosphaerae]|uniref:Transcriptional regulator n=1 Tax=Microbacterium rhizosphaerae TaxID=1678237 RepID=A0ABZ0SK98_9MICO|nr:hypothetical protein [Microbacterium rhizosphaerae]WPR88595.1 hypothetical protein SM116_12540 [Microbacterium rhizosphaerae]
MIDATRDRVARLLAEADGAMDAAAVAAAVGIHVTTARFHLDRLVDAGQALRAPMAEGMRGRPRVGYSPAAAMRTEPSRAAMVAALAGALADDPDGPVRARAAGRAWAATLGGAPELVDVLERLGFAPESDGDGIRLRACPFLDAARIHPGIVCQVHRGIIERVVGDAAADVRLIPFEGTRGCLVALPMS